MRKGTFISIIALVVAVVGIVIALLTYFKRKRCVLCDGFDEDFIIDEEYDYFETDIDDEQDLEQESDEYTAQ